MTVGERAELRALDKKFDRIEMEKEKPIEPASINDVIASIRSFFKKHGIKTE